MLKVKIRPSLLWWNTATTNMSILCGQAYGLVKEIQRKMSYQLRFVFRNFPLTGPLILFCGDRCRGGRVGRRARKVLADARPPIRKPRQARIRVARFGCRPTLSLDVEGFVYDIRGRKVQRADKTRFQKRRSQRRERNAVFLYRRRSLHDGSWESGELAEELAMQKRQ